VTFVFEAEQSTVLSFDTIIYYYIAYLYLSFEFHCVYMYSISIILSPFSTCT